MRHTHVRSIEQVPSDDHVHEGEFTATDGVGTVGTGFGGDIGGPL